MRDETTKLKAFALTAIALSVLAVCVGSARSRGAQGRLKQPPVGIASLPLLPRGIPAALWLKHIPANNLLTGAKVALGEQLFFDKRLSLDGTISCATCHDPASAFAGHEPRAVGLGGRPGARNAPTVLNAMFRPAQFWDGRAASLEEQLTQPLVNPAEMGMQSYEAVVARVEASPEYDRAFARAFGVEGVSIQKIAKAIAAYERTLLSGDAPFDRFVAGDASSLTEAQRRGWALFKGKAQCNTCHTFTTAAPFFTDFKFHNTGAAAPPQGFAQLIGDAASSAAGGRSGALGRLSHEGDLAELGRYLVTGQPEDIGAFQTPTLRDVELTSPYMHDGSEKTLIDVVRFYNGGGHPNQHLDAKVRPLNLSDAEMNDLVEFLRALTSDDVLRLAQTVNPQTRTPVPVPEARPVRADDSTRPAVRVSARRRPLSD